MSGKRLLPALVPGLGAWLLAASPALAQEAETGRGCTLILEPTEDTRSVSRRVGPDQYVTHVGGGMRWLCGDARVEADSAVNYDREERVEMIGSVDYRDSVRTLSSRRLTYFEREDRIVAERNVELVRLSTGTVLTGPRVEFFRGPHALGSEAERTVATGRPHLTLPRDPGADDPPFEIDADRAELLGEREAHFRGAVRIERSDFAASSDSAFFDLTEERGVLLGSPEVEGEEFHLTGSEIRLDFAEGSLREIAARGDGRATGEEFDLYSERIRTRLRDERVERIAAFGEGRAVGHSSPYRFDGDSLDFAFRDGQLDTLTVVDSAAAVEVGEGQIDPATDPPLDVTGEASWLAGDTLWLIMEPADSPSVGREAAAAREEAEPAGEADPAEPEETAGAGDPEAGGAGERSRRIERLRAVGHARSFYLVGGANDGRDAETDIAGGESPPGESSRNYLIGREIVVLFEEGQASRVRGRQAIGIYLDPSGVGEGPPDPSLPQEGAPELEEPGTPALPPDSLPAEDSLPEDGNRPW